MQTNSPILGIKLSRETIGRLQVVADGELETAPLLYQVANLTQADDVLRWLIQNRITGKRFLHWVKFEHGSLLKAMAHAVNTVNRETMMRPLFAGKDLKE